MRTVIDTAGTMAADGQPPGGVLVIAGPSGVGKGTVIRALLDRRPDLWLSISATTRRQRPGEQDGREYLFLSDAQFDALIAQGRLLEYATFAGHRYGTPAQPVHRRMAAGLATVLEIDVQGAEQVAQQMPGAVRVLLIPPSTDELRRRLIGRGTEDEAALQRRLAAAATELAAAHRFSHVLVNDDVEDTVDRLLALLGSPSVVRADSPAQPSSDQPSSDQPSSEQPSDEQPGSEQPSNSEQKE